MSTQNKVYEALLASPKQQIWQRAIVKISGALNKSLIKLQLIEDRAHGTFTVAPVPPGWLLILPPSNHSISLGQH